MQLPPGPMAAPARDCGRRVPGLRAPARRRPAAARPRPRAPRRLIGWAGEDRYLERELPPRPRRPRGGLAAPHRRRRAGHPGNQVQGRELPLGAVREQRLRGGALRTEPVERRRDRLPRGPGGRRADLRGPAGLRQGRQGPGAGTAGPGRDLRRRARLEPVRAQRPRARRRAHALQAAVAGRAQGPGRGLAPGQPAGPDRPHGRLERRPPGRGRLGTSTFSAARATPTSASPSAPRSAPSRTPASPTSYAPSPPAPASTPTGTTPNCASPRRRACASTSCWAPPRWPAG